MNYTFLFHNYTYKSTLRWRAPNELRDIASWIRLFRPNIRALFERLLIYILTQPSVMQDYKVHQTSTDEIMDRPSSFVSNDSPVPVPVSFPFSSPNAATAL